ncbi:MAG: DUF115 domain-containing protein [Synergistaceae bacterium]|jgi:hypothetical protein|nr:DUF115 domain-containing protein [Synergistaceae bacterium]
MFKKLSELRQSLIYELKHIRLVRILAFPFLMYSRNKSWKRYQNSEDRAYIKGLKHKHAGGRCFIIGNGPSLSPRDLDNIKDECCFGTNRIYHIFDKTDWRPVYYVSVDLDVIGNEVTSIEGADIKEKFIYDVARSHFVNGRLRNNKSNIHFIRINWTFALKKNKTPCLTFSKDVSNYFTNYYTVTCTCIELAIYMGFKEIYLLGVDHNYPVQLLEDGTIIRDPSVKTYFDGMQGGERIAVQPVDAVNKSYAVCKEYADAHGIKIYNATRGGKLEIFERVDFDKLMRDRKL